MPLKDMLSVSHPKNFLRMPQTLPTTSVIIFPTDEKISPKPLNLSTTPFKRSDIPEIILERTPEIPFMSNALLRELRKSPIFAVISKRKPPRLLTPSEPRNWAIAFPTVPNIFLKISKTEKTPLNVLLSLSAVSLLIFNFSVKSLIFLVILSN